MYFIMFLCVLCFTCQEVKFAQRTIKSNVSMCLYKCNSKPSRKLMWKPYIKTLNRISSMDNGWIMEYFVGVSTDQVNLSL